MDAGEEDEGMTSLGEEMGGDLGSLTFVLTD